MNLSQAQHNFFDTFGYLAFPKLFGDDEIAWIAGEFEKVLNEHGEGKTARWL